MECVFCLLGIVWFVLQGSLHFVSHHSKGFRLYLSQSRVSKVISSHRNDRSSTLRARGKPFELKQRKGYSLLFFWMAILCVCRVGEASNPGPHDNGVEWTLGTFNPSGVTSKADIIGQLDWMEIFGVCAKRT